MYARANATDEQARFLSNHDSRVAAKPNRSASVRPHIPHALTISSAERS